MMVTVLPVAIFAAFASSVSICISSVKAVIYTDCNLIKDCSALIICFDRNDIAVLHSGCPVHRFGDMWM